MMRHGFGLVEVFLALTLLGVALLGVAASSLWALRLLRQADAGESGALAALQVLDSLAQEQTPAAGQRSSAHFQLSWQVQVRPDSALRVFDVYVSYTEGQARQTDRYRLAQRVTQP